MRVLIAQLATDPGVGVDINAGPLLWICGGLLVIALIGAIVRGWRR